MSDSTCANNNLAKKHVTRTSCSEERVVTPNVKIVMSSPEEVNPLLPGKMVLTMQKLNATSNAQGKICGFHLTKSKWDPYPWVGHVENNSRADLAGFRAGDCLLAVDDIDLAGLKIKDIATLIHSNEGEYDINCSIWRYTHQKENQSDIGLALKGPLPDVARNLANALSRTVRILECPICLESAAPPVSQCVHGHILCVVCRPKTTRCPVCRVRLGQGRCLLADKLHKVLRDSFNVNNDETLDGTSDRHNLRDRLFGKNSKKQEAPITSQSKTNYSALLKPRQFLLARLLLGGREKAASADNLTKVSELSEGTAITFNKMTDTNSVRLSSNDRAKSASTGELSRNSATRADDASSRNVELSVLTNTSQQSLSLPRTPVWGGSVDSMSCTYLACPLLQSCREVITSDSLLEHLRSHAVPQIHFYSGSAKIPLPLPFGCDALYILHHGSNIFFFQCGDKTSWMTYPGKISHAHNMWEWTLHAWDNNTEVRWRRYVASLEDPLTLSAQHIAPLSDALLLKTLNIQILENRGHDKLYV